MERYFDLKNISLDDVYVGDIYIIERTFKNLINKVKKLNPECEDLSTICYRRPAKKDAILIKINDNFVDFDYIRSNSDIETINELINKNSINNNIIMSLGTLDPYIGQLYVDRFTLKNIIENKRILTKYTLR